MPFIAKVTHSRDTDKDTSSEFSTAELAWFCVVDQLEAASDAVFERLSDEGIGLNAITTHPEYAAHKRAEWEVFGKSWDEPGSVIVALGSVQEGDAIVYGVIESETTDSTTQPE